MAFIEARDLARIYRPNSPTPVRALDGVTLDVESGELVAVLGKSGSGKSTLMNLLGGLDSPTAGSLSVGGWKLSDLSPSRMADYRARTVGFVFQAFHLQQRMSAWENVALPLIFTGRPKRERKERAMALLERVSLADRAEHRPTEMSGGEQQRVALARSLITEPKLLLGDEPTGNLDTRTAEQIMGLITEAHERGTTVVIVTHDPDIADEYATRTIRMADGKVIDDVKAAQRVAGPESGVSA